MSIEAMKIALEALETDFDMPSEQYRAEDEAIKVLRAAIKQAEKPVAWMHPEWNTYTRAPAMSIAAKEDWIPLYTAPPQRSWQGLTDEEVRAFEVWLDDEEEKHGWNPPQDIIKYIEAKLKEKNNAV